MCLYFSLLFVLSLYIYSYRYVHDGLTFLSLFACTIEKPAASIFPLIPYSLHIFFIFLPMCIWNLYLHISLLICEWIWPQFFAHPPRSSFYEPHHIYINIHNIWKSQEWRVEMEAKLCTCKANCMSFFPTIIIRHNIYTSHTEYYKRTKNGIEKGILRHRALGLFLSSYYFHSIRTYTSDYIAQYVLHAICMFTYLPFIVCKKRHFRRIYVAWTSPSYKAFFCRTGEEMKQDVKKKKRACVYDKE